MRSRVWEGGNSGRRVCNRVRIIRWGVGGVGGVLCNCVHISIYGGGVKKRKRLRAKKGRRVFNVVCLK